MGDRWRYGDVVIRREVLGLAPVHEDNGHEAPWHGRPWLAVPVHVVEDTDEALVTYIAPGAEFGHFPGEWPTPDKHHPWAGRRAWTGHGCLMVQRPGDHHAVWHFWSGDAREFECWYINIQSDFVRTERGYDTQDLELDIVVFPGGEWLVKDDDVLVDRIDEGRFSPLLVAWIESLGADLTAELEAGRRWWDETWSRWTPDDSWWNTALPPRWADY
jgi:hypothetical protein